LTTFLLALTALFSIVNPLSGAFIFFGATRELPTPVRSQVARWVGIYSFCIMAASLYVGAYVLGFFGVSIPVLRVAGGIIVAAAGWRMLNAPDATELRRNETPSPASVDVAPSKLAFYPLTMPLTTGPGTISVAISIGAGRPGGFHVSSLAFFVETLAATALLSVVIYGFYRNSARLAQWIGATGTTIVVRLSAFLLFCIGIQVLWNGAAELLSTLPFNTAS
jgi:multiple antibiotic resistance protein